MFTWALFLDDLRDLSYLTNTHGYEYWYTARSTEEAKKLILTYGMPAYIAFDHDLGLDSEGLEDKATNLLKWMNEVGIVHIMPPPAHGVHSSNPVGRDNINAFMSSWRKLHVGKE